MKNDFSPATLLSVVEDFFDEGFLSWAIGSIESIIESDLEFPADPISPDEAVRLLERLQALAAIKRKLTAIKEAM